MHIGVKPWGLVCVTFSSLRNCDLYRMSLRATLLGLLDSSRSSVGRRREEKERKEEEGKVER
jgi:hypothetical protein